MELQPQFASNVRASFDAGQEWLEELHTLLDNVSQCWFLTFEPPFPNLSYNYVAPATRADGTLAILKLGVPDAEFTAGIAALRLYDGLGAVRLLEHDAEAGAMLLERLYPGAMLHKLADDERETSIAANVMKRLWRPLPAEHPFPSLARWFRALTEWRAKHGGTSGPIPALLFDAAEVMHLELLSSLGEIVLLHGDIHHFNILSAEREPWLAIDPKGIAGEREFDTAQYLLNPWPDLLKMPNPREILARRADQFADELGLDRQRILGWGVANAVLSACWEINEEDASSRYDLSCAELLHSLLTQS